MSMQANKTLIGLFVLGAVALSVGAILFFGSGKFLTDSDRYVLYFEGSVKGLNKGAPVVLKGVKLGKVTDISLQFDADTLDFRTEVIIEILDRIELIRQGLVVEENQGRADEELDRLEDEHLDLLVSKGMRAQLAIESILTGFLMVELDFFPEAELKLHATEGLLKQIPTIPSSIERITSSIEKLPIEKIINEAHTTLKGLDKLVNSQAAEGSLVELHGALKEVRDLVGGLRDRSRPFEEDAQRILASTRRLLETLETRLAPLADRLERGLTVATTLAERMDDLAVRVDGRLDPLADDVEATLTEARTFMKRLGDQAEGLFEETNRTLGDVRDTLDTARNSLTRVEQWTDPGSDLARRMAETLKSLDDTLDAIRSLADYLERHPEALLKGKAGG